MKLYDEYEDYKEIETDDITARRTVNKIKALGDAVTAGLLGEELTWEQEEALEWMDEVKEERDRREREEKKAKFHVMGNVTTKM